MSNNNQTMIRDMTEGSVLRKLLLFSLPLMLGNLLQTVYGLADSVIIGQFVGAAGLAAVITGGEAINVITLISMGLASAGQVLIGQHIGRRDYDSISRTVGALFAVLLVTGVAFLLLFVFLDDWVLRALSMPAESYAYGKRYVVTCAMGSFAIVGYNAVAAILRGMGDANRPMVFVAITSVLNILLDLVFVAGLHMDSFGAALATVISQYISFIISLIYLWHRRESLGFNVSRTAMRPARRDVRLVLRLGVPHAVQTGAIWVSMLFIVSLINRYGVAASAANGIAMKLENINRVVCTAMGTAACTIIAQNFGAKKYDRIDSVIRNLLLITFIYCLALGLVIFFFPQPVFSLFTKDADVLLLAALYAPAGFFISLGHSVRIPYMQLANGIGNARLGLIMGLMDGVVMRIGLSLLLGYALNLGLVGFWWGSAIAGFTPAVIGAVYYYSGRWKKFEL